MADVTSTQDAKMMITITHSKGAAPDVKVAVKKVSQLRKVFAAAADRFRTTPDALIFKYNGTVLEGEHTPKMHEIPEGGIITAYPAGEEEPSTQNVQDTQVTMDGFGDNAMEQDDTGPPSSSAKNDKITLVIRSQEGPSFNIKVVRGKPLKLAFEKAHEQFRKAPKTFRFFYNGTRLKEDDTPKMHEMENNDEIDANIQQNSWGVQRKSRIDLNGDVPSPSLTPAAPTPTAITPEEPPAQKRKSRTTHGTSKRAKASHEPPTTRLSDLGGVTEAVEKLLELVALPVCHPEVYLHTGVQPPRGVLLHGPPGCGKTMLANAIAGELGVPFISVSAPSIVSGMSGESEKTLRDTFDEAKKNAPCLLFIDEIDAITPKRESAQREMERRIVAQFLTCMDDLAWEHTEHKPVIVIGATNRPDSLDPALRRAGRFDHEISMGVPDESGRQQILKTLLDKLRLAGPAEEYTMALARATPGYVGADLASLTSAAGVIAVKRIFKGLLSGAFIASDEPITAPEESPHITQVIAPNDPPEKPNPLVDDIEMAPSDETQGAPPTLDEETVITSTSSALTTLLRSTPLTPEQLSKLTISLPDFLAALETTQPSATREGFTTRPDVSWADIGALKGIREELEMAVVWPIRRYVSYLT
ncbi:putative AAA domain-containing protein C16E9,10c [Rhizoctonia solani AG-1 IB]|uniref:Putative AAA domain-containing protein C16E9,10c n=1 Tax=Thanatephorus cucumeris (strain AG1-IB / isolate 7/3/14) TaxID=1108050 RepID=M5C8T2_THACB|nr:putative AAA domain-containing protein C16E9,10c [Rhizoctonia solani AG-1 IB]